VSLTGDIVQRHLEEEGHRAILLWKRKEKAARLQILVGDRFPLLLRLEGAEKGTEIIELARALDLDGLARVRAPGEPTDLGVAPATQPSASQPTQPGTPGTGAPGTGASRPAR
jgi:hypothetical protein